MSETKLSLAALERLADGATRSWLAVEKFPSSVIREFEIRDNGGTLFRSTSYERMEEDARFIQAACAHNVKTLITEIRRLRGALLRIPELTGHPMICAPGAYCEMGCAALHVAHDALSRSEVGE